MSIEIDILNGKASRTMAAPLLDAAWPKHETAKLPWGHIEWAEPDLRVLIEEASSGLVCHAGIFFRTILWNGHKMHVGGIGALATREDCRGRGYATLALEAATQTMRANEAARFAILFCQPHLFAFYEARGWHRFTGEVHAEQDSGRFSYDFMTPFVFDLGRAPRQGSIDLCGLPW